MFHEADPYPDKNETDPQDSYGVKQNVFLNI